MISVDISITVFACLLFGVSIGTTLHRVLPERLLNQETRDVIRLATGLMSTLVALVLGLLINSANTNRNLIENEYRSALADILLLDGYLADIGPSAEPSREILRALALHAFKTTWPTEDFTPAKPVAPGGQATPEILRQSLLHLAPGDDMQRWNQSHGLDLVSSLSHVRWLLINQQTSPQLPLPLLIGLAAWGTVIFMGFGLIARANVTVIVALGITALALAGAVFLVLDLGNPFSGFMQIPSTPAHAALALLGH